MAIFKQVEKTIMKFSGIIVSWVIIGAVHFAFSGVVITDFSYAAPQGAGSRPPLAARPGEEQETDRRRTPPDPDMIYLPIDLGGKQCKMAKTADGFEGYMDIDGDDIEEKVRITKKEDGTLLHGSFGKHVLEFDYDEDATPRTALLDDGRGGATIFDFNGSVRLTGKKGEAEFMIIHDGLMVLLDKQRIALLSKNGIATPSLEPGDPGISAFADHPDFRENPDRKAFAALTEKRREIRENRARIIEILGEEVYEKFKKNYFLYKALAERNADYMATITRHFDGTYLD